MTYILRPLILATAFLFTLTAINYVVDPPGPGFGIAKLLAENWNVALSEFSFDKRRLQEQYVAFIKERKDVVAIGSSRSMQIRASHLGTSSFFNSCVGSATLEDYLGVYNIYRRRGLSPDVLIIGLDPWLLNRHHGVTAWETIGSSVKEVADFIGVSFEDEARDFWTPSRLVHLVILDRYLQLASLRRFQDSLEHLIYFMRDPLESEYYPTTDMQSEHGMILLDGSLVYPLHYRSRSVGESWPHFTKSQS